MTDPIPPRQGTASLVDDAPHELRTLIAKGSDRFGIAVLHAGEAVAFLSPKEARLTAKRLNILATTCERPGQCPELVG